MKQNLYLQESLKKLEDDSFDERDVKLLLIEIRDFLSEESFLREVADFVAHPTRSRGLCHVTINSRYGKMKFADEGQQRLIDQNIFSENPEKPWSFFSEQILDYIQPNKIEKSLFEIIIKEGIEEIPNDIFLKYYNVTKNRVKTIVFSSYVKADGYYKIKPSVQGKKFLFLDEILKFIRGTITGASAFDDNDLKKDLKSSISRIVAKQKLQIETEHIFKILDGVIVCIISILHNVVFEMFDGTSAVSYLTTNPTIPGEENQDQFLNLYVSTQRFNFPIISTSILIQDYTELSKTELYNYGGKSLPFNYATRNASSRLILAQRFQ